jgi:hypothetical protein
VQSSELVFEHGTVVVVSVTDVVVSVQPNVVVSVELVDVVCGV